LVCAFQVLEHLPYELALQAFAEMVRVSRRYVVISLPDAKPLWRYLAHIPLFGPVEFVVPRPFFGKPVNVFNGGHHWEINKREYPLVRVQADLSKIGRLLKTYRVPENPYHRFFVFER
jgi:hypothetical protein